MLLAFVDSLNQLTELGLLACMLCVSCVTLACILLGLFVVQGMKLIENSLSRVCAIRQETACIIDHTVLYAHEELHRHCNQANSMLQDAHRH